MYSIVDLFVIYFDPIYVYSCGFSKLCTGNSGIYHKIFFTWRYVASWVTFVAVTHPAIVFDSHPSCQSVCRTKVSKPRLMTSCLGSAPYQRGLNTVKLAFCVLMTASTENHLALPLQALDTHAKTHALQLCQEWALRQGVTTGTAARARSQS